MWFLFLLCSLLAPNHKFYVSKCHIDYVPEKASLQVRLHFFTEDVEVEMKKEGFPKTRLFTKWESEEADKHLTKYLNDHLKFEVNGSPVSYTFIGREADQDLQGAWCYLEITGIQELNSMTIRNTLLVDEFEKQQNIILINRPNKKTVFLMLSQQNRSETINLSTDE